MNCPFTVNRKELLDSLRHLKKLSEIAGHEDPQLEGTLSKNKLTLNIPGGSVFVHAATEGGAKFSTTLLYLLELVETYRDKELKFILETNKLRINYTSAGIKTTFFETDAILRSIDLPLNYDFTDLIKLKLSGKYSPEEIDFNELGEKIKEAENQLNEDVDALYAILIKYKFKRPEAEQLLMNQLLAGMG